MKRKARVSGSILGVVGSVWGILDQIVSAATLPSDLQELWERYMGDAPVALPWLIALAGMVLFLWAMIPTKVEKAPIMSDEKDATPIFDQSIKADGNSGNIFPTYNNEVNIAPAPRLDLIKDPEVIRNSDKSHTVKFLVNAPVPISRLTVQGQGEGVSRISVQREILNGVGATNKSEVRRSVESGLATESFTNAHGRYEVSILTTGDPQSVRLAVQVD